MMKARLLTIGTEITAGEIINSNAAWISQRLEERGARVYAHLTVRDQRDEILTALESFPSGDLIIVTGGLGPTSDDITRECLAEYCGQPLEFDEGVWTGLVHSNQSRGLTTREAHRHQCWFPRGSERFKNPVGTALGFGVSKGKQKLMVLPGPPRELAGMWAAEVDPRLTELVGTPDRIWVRWNTLGAPESEVAELVEPLIEGRSVEVGYRAQVPYVKVKVYAHPTADKDLIERIDQALSPWIVGRGIHDLAEELLELWPTETLTVVDGMTRLNLINRLFTAQRARSDAGLKRPEVQFFSSPRPPPVTEGLVITAAGEELLTELHLNGVTKIDRRQLMFKLTLDSERGRRAAAEWALWHAVKSLRPKTK